MPDDALTALQREVLGMFFTLPESAGFVLAGGAALIASGLSERPTQDVDLFTGDLGQGITEAADALEAACHDPMVTLVGLPFVALDRHQDR